MKRSAIIISGLMLFCTTVLAATVSRSTEDQLKQLEQRVAKAGESIVAEYAKENLETAKLTLTSAKVSAAAGRENETVIKIELALAELDLAEARASEKELMEKVALHRADLKKSEALLEKYRMGEGN